MVHRIRIKGADGRDIVRDIDRGPGPVGLMPKHIIHGWAIDRAAATIKRDATPRER